MAVLVAEREGREGVSGDDGHILRAVHLVGHRAIDDLAAEARLPQLQDLWGVDPRPSPRFVRRYIDGVHVLTDALNRYDADVKDARFPEAKESYSG